MQSTIHHSGFLAIFSIRMIFTMEIQASQAFSVLVLFAMVCNASER